MLRRIGLIVVISSLLASCDLLFDVARRQFSVDLDPTEVTIARGESAEITVTLTLYTGFDFSLEEATVKLIDPPEGVTADPLTMPGNILERKLTIRISPTTDLLEDEEIIVEVTKGVGKDAKFNLTITE
jgi:hypothetical protein